MANTQALISEFFSLLPKAAAFEAGQPIQIPVPSAEYTVDLGGQKVEVSEPGFVITVKKA